MITYDDFAKLELAVGTITAAERVEGSDKLLKLGVNLGEETRQIVAGIGKSYEPETLMGRQIVVIKNLEPRKLMGLESQGMLLAADSSEGPTFLTPEAPVNPGSRVK